MFELDVETMIEINLKAMHACERYRRKIAPLYNKYLYYIELASMVSTFPVTLSTCPYD